MKWNLEIEIFLKFDNVNLVYKYLIKLTDASKKHMIISKICFYETRLMIYRVVIKSSLGLPSSVQERCFWNGSAI